MKKIVLFLIFLSGNLIYAEDVTISDYMKLGEIYFLEEDYSNAKTVYKEVLSIDEVNKIAIERLAEIAVSQVDDKAAISYYEKIVELGEVDKMVYFALGELYTEKNKDKMYENYELYLEKDQYKDSKFIFILGETYFKDKLYEKAMDIFQKDKSEELKNIYGLALCSRFLGYYKKSIRYYKKCIDKNYDFAEAYLGIALAYRQNGDFNNSASYFEDYLSRKKDHEAYLALAELYFLMNKYDDAKKIAKEGLKEFSDSKELKDFLIELYGN